MGEAVRATAAGKRLSSVLALVIAAAAPSVRAEAPATASAPAPSRGWAHVAVDTSQIGEAGPAIRRRVQERSDVVLRRAGVMPGRGPQDPTISVVIREVEGDKPGWTYAITIRRADEPPRVDETNACELCTETELVDAIEGRLARLAGELEADEAPPPPRPAPTTAASSSLPPVHDAPASPVRLGGKGKAGVALLGIGGAALVAGVALVALPDRPKPGDPTHEIFTQPPGYALLATSGAAFVVGLALLVVDRVQAKRDRGRVALGRGLVLRF